MCAIAQNSDSSDQEEYAEEDSHASGYPPVDHVQNAQKLSPFWRDRLIEAGMIGSMACYYVIGNYNLGANGFFHLNPLLSLPFLLLFALLSWYRLPFAVALLPMALPYFYLQKPVYSHYQFSLVEIVLGVCAAVALVQVLVKQNGWPYRLSWRELRDRLGPFIVPTLIFALAAAISVVIAYARRDALRAFREEVFDPLLFLVLARVVFDVTDRSAVDGALSARADLQRQDDGSYAWLAAADVPRRRPRRRAGRAIQMISARVTDEAGPRATQGTIVLEGKRLVLETTSRPRATRQSAMPPIACCASATRARPTPRSRSGASIR